VESTPFEAKISSMPQSPKVAVPFEVGFTITNKTTVHQSLKIEMKDSDSRSSTDVLISGLCNGHIYLGPQEQRLIVFYILATKAGKVFLPNLNISSARYNSWVIRGFPDIFVFP